MRGRVPVAIVKSGQYPEVYRTDGAVGPTRGPSRTNFGHVSGRGEDKAEGLLSLAHDARDAEQQF